MKRFLCVTLIAICMASCTTYTITPQSFKEQFVGVDAKSLQQVEINNPLSFHNISYEANNIKYIEVIDKAGNMVALQNSPSIEMRVTTKDGKKRIMYFDTVSLQNNILYGKGARLLGGINRTIPLDSVVKIEVQDGGKNYYYKN